jgi:hypothetical protein
MHFPFLSNFSVTLGFAPIYRNWQKTRHRDFDGNSPNRQAVGGNPIIP